VAQALRSKIGIELDAAVGVCAPAPMLDRIREALESKGLSPRHEVGDVPELQRTCGEAPPGIVVIAVPRPGTATIDAIRTLRQDAETPPYIIIVCDRSGDGDVHRALAAGATGVVLSAELERALLPVLLAVSAGQVSVPGAHGDEVRARVLTNREKQILSLVVMGMTNAQIGTKLFLAESTVKSHLSSSFTKLNVASRSEAVNLILDPKRGGGLGILRIPSEPVVSRRRTAAGNGRQ